MKRGRRRKYESRDSAWRPNKDKIHDDLHQRDRKIEQIKRG